MPVKHMEHVGIVVDDLAAATAFFVALGLEVQGEGRVGGDWVDRIIGLDGTEADIAMLQTADGRNALELVKFNSPSGAGGDPGAPANIPGLRHLAFLVDDLDAVVGASRSHGGELVGEIERYEDIYRLCYLRGPAGVIVELAEKLG